MSSPATLACRLPSAEWQAYGTFLQSPKQTFGTAAPRLHRVRAMEDLNRNCVQTVIQVFTKTSVSNGLCQVYIGSGNNTHIGLFHLRRTYFDEFTALEHTQQACLGRQRQFADFIKEDCSAVGLTEIPLPFADSPGKCALLMTEQFRVNRPSGMAPQFTAMYCPCLRRLYWCIICGKLSFPTPLSPVISTDKSVGATWIAISMARISASLLPIMPKRNFTCCISAFVILQIFFYTIEFQFVAIVTFLVILLAQRICMCLFLTLAVTEHIYCHIDSLPE